jgi:glycosyltransferase involved in cell wall biosynthesis
MVPDRQLWVWYTPFGLGGVETFLLNLTRTAVERGAEMWIAAVQSTNGPLRASFDAAARVNLLDWTGFYPAHASQTPSEAVCRQVTDELHRIRPTLLAVNGCMEFGTGFAPLIRHLRDHFHVIDTLHIDPPDSRYLERRLPYVDVLDGVTSSNADALHKFDRIVPAARHLAKRYIPYGAVVPSRTRAEPAEPLRLLYTGRLVQEQKRVLELPAILERLRSLGRPFRMTIVGDGYERAALEAEIRRLKLDEWVQLVGYVSPANITAYYFDHDVLVNVSSYEGFSISTIEALAAGCVPVCTELPGLDRSVFVDGQTCRLCPIDDLPRMSDILSQLSHTEISRLSAGARRVGSEFTVARMVDNYTDFTRGLASLRTLRPWSAAEGLS